MKVQVFRRWVALVALTGLTAIVGCGDPCLDDGKGKGVCNAQDGSSSADASETEAEAELSEAEAEAEAEASEAEAGGSCDNQMQDEGETDVDCGGTCVATDGTGKCDDGQMCEDNGDCVSDLCDAGICVPVAPVCENGSQDAGETDVDCGGACVEDPGDPANPAGKCDDGESCEMDGDCVSNLCDMGICVPEGPLLCENMMMDEGETGVDCGGPCVEDPADPDNETGKCIVGEPCLVDGDCVTELCEAGSCVPNPCQDMAQNNDETDVDCGGSCVIDPADPLNPVGKCDIDEGCMVDSDCVSNSCDPNTNVCVEVCTNMMQDDAETDVDCGGACVVDPDDPQNPEGKCDDGEGCMVDSDCITNACDPETNTCLGVCENGVFDPDQETDVDCGDQCVLVNPNDMNDVEGQCNDMEMCEDNEDCVAGECANGQCDVCAVQDDYTTCQTCLVSSCCLAVQECLADIPKCVCWFNCIGQQGSTVQSCMDSCGNGNIGTINSCVNNTCKTDCQ